MKYGINRYSGSWKSEDGYRLDINKTSNKSAVVCFYNPSCNPVVRIYFNNKPAINMLASYDDYSGEFRIDLWKNSKGFELHINYEPEYELDKLKREALIPAISRYGKDDFLDKYYGLFGALKHFVRVTDKNDNIVTGHFTTPY